MNKEDPHSTLLMSNPFRLASIVLDVLYKIAAVVGVLLTVATLWAGR